MTTLTLQSRPAAHPNVRALNILRDLPEVADLIELCFSHTMDGEGKRYVQDMRRAGHDSGFLRWAARLGDSTSLPLSGYLWEENDRIVGNASLVPFRHERQRIYLIANVAVHPDYRRRGIARALANRALEHIRQRKAAASWLHVRADNPGAIRMYSDLGFEERARRTTWSAPSDPELVDEQGRFVVTARQPRFWPLQLEWLHRSYPDELAWHRPWNFSVLRPGFLNWISCLMLDINVRQWAAIEDQQLQAVLAWMPGGRDESLYAAVRPGADPMVLSVLLKRARRELHLRSHLTIELPGGDYDPALEQAGFKPQRTLIWMRLKYAT